LGVEEVEQLDYVKGRKMTCPKPRSKSSKTPFLNFMFKKSTLEVIRSPSVKPNP
jgi:hypothetical protein